MSLIMIGPNGENIDQIQSSRDRVFTREDTPHDVKVRVRHKLTEIRGREAWMGGRFPAIRENLARNLEHATLLDFAPIQELVGQPAVVVSAGPSLIDHVTDDRARWYVTNQAASVFDDDVFVCCESFDVNSDVLCAPLAIVDAACHPANIPDARVSRMFFRSDAMYTGLAKRYGVEPVPYGSSVSTAAVAVAARHQAPVIVLLGQDLAIHPDGRYYADGIPGSEMRVSFVERDGCTWAVFPERPGKMQKPPTPVFNEDGLWVTQDFADLRAWFSTFATLHPHIKLINATSRGINIPGWENMPLAEALAVCESHKPKPTQAERFPEMSGDLVEDLRRVRQWEAAVPECALWEYEDRTKPHKRESKETIEWSIEVARSAARKMGLI
jgi:hypothetical protein